MTRTPGHLGAAMLLALPLLFPRQADAQRSHRDREDQRSRTVDTTVAFDPSGIVSVSIPDGEIVVTGWNRDAVRVHASSDDGVLRFAASSRRITVEPDGFRRGSDCIVEISVPIGTRVAARAISGDIAVRGSRGEVEATAQSGDITLEDVAGRIDVNTFSGSIAASGVAGDVEIRSLSGDVTLVSVGGDIEIETVSGDIEIGGARAKLVRARSTSGDLRYAGTIDPQGRYELASHSGDVRLTVPDDAGAQISISTWSGTVESAFPMTLKPGEHGIGSASAKRFTFDVGSGRSRVTLESFSGDITIDASGTSTRPRGRQ